jgi:hypothetical protein
VAWAVDKAGNTASAKATPTRLTGTDWKLRAKLTAVTDPAASPDATALKNRNVIGSTGWLTIFGSIRRTNSRMGGVLPSQPRPMRNALPRRPMKRLPRWIDAPITAPMAGP